MKRLPLILAALILIGGGFTIKMYNGLQRADESVSAAWSEVTNQYQRRADLVGRRELERGLRLPGATGQYDPGYVRYENVGRQR